MAPAVLATDKNLRVPSESCFLLIGFYFLESNLLNTPCHGALIGV
jgi:hypothetical protein